MRGSDAMDGMTPYLGTPRSSAPPWGPASTPYDPLAADRQRQQQEFWTTVAGVVIVGAVMVGGVVLLRNALG